MPVSCPGGGKPRFRVTTKGGKKIRLAFCGNKVVEAISLKKRKRKRKGHNSAHIR